MSPVAPAECLGRFIAQAGRFSCCVVGAVRSSSHTCKGRHGLIVEEEKSSFNVTKYWGQLSPASSNDPLLLYIMMLQSSSHPALDPSRECLAHTLQGAWTVH